ncbi:VOC family protein [Candidatus Bathyarchaeota archaeon]|nr:VOC family protein [Candidatus Bathyarchaeota archaeon]
MKLIGVDHIHFFATDLDEAVRFYEDMGFRLGRRFEHGGREAVQMVSGFGLTVDINKTRASDNPGYSHFSVLVEDVDEAYGDLKDKGYWVDGPTINEDTGRRIITVRDPNGFLFQMVETS